VNKNILDVDTELSICLAKKHPYNKMKLNGVEVSGYRPKKYLLPAGTDLSSLEVKAWFKIDGALTEDLEKPAKTPAKKRKSKA